MLNYLLFIFIFVGCSSSSKKKADPIEDKYANVKFEKVQEKKLDGTFSYSDKATNSRKFLEDVSASRVYQNFDEDDFEKDPISNIAYSCYKNNRKKFEVLVRKHSRSYEKHPGFWNQVGICYLLFKQERKALLFFNKSTNIDNSFLPAQVNVYYYYLLRGELQRSIVVLERLLKKYPNNKVVKFNLATLLLDNHINLNAKNMFESLLELDADDPDLNGAIGTAYYFLGDYSLAGQYFSKISDDNLKDPLWGINYARVLLKLKQNEKAKNYFYKVNQEDSKYDAYFKATKPLVDNS